MSKEKKKKTATSTGTSSSLEPNFTICVCLTTPIQSFVLLHIFHQAGHHSDSGLTQDQKWH